MKVILYRRTSTGADDNFGLAAQKEYLYQYAKFKKWDIVEDFEEVYTGGKMTTRRQLMKAMDLLKDGKADALVVSHQDRLSRNHEDFMKIMRRSSEEGWALIALDVSVDTSTATGRMIARMMSVIADWERELIGERTKAALAAAKERGVKFGRKSKLDPSVRARIFEMNQTMRPIEIVQILNAEGVPTSQGKPGTWTIASVKYIIKTYQPEIG